MPLPEHDSFNMVCGECAIEHVLRIPDTSCHLHGVGGYRDARLLNSSVCVMVGLLRIRFCHKEVLPTSKTVICCFSLSLGAAAVLGAGSLM
jgi:hypothetical protein